MQPELAAWSDEAIDDQQRQYLLPLHTRSPVRLQTRMPELIQLQLPPQFATQPAATITSRAMQLDLIQTNGHTVELLRRYHVRRGKQRHPLRLIANGIKDLQGSAPGLFLIAGKFAEVNHLLLYPLAQSAALLFHHTVIGVFLTVLLTISGTDEHVYQYRKRQKKLIQPAAKVGLYRTGFEKKYRLALPPRPLKYFFSPKTQPKCEGWAKREHGIADREIDHG